MQWPWQRGEAAREPAQSGARAALRVSRRRASVSSRDTGGGRAISRPAWLTQQPALFGVIGGDQQLWLLLEEMRRTLPLVDRGVTLLSELCGEIEVEGPKKTESDLKDWLRRVPVNQTQRGLSSWLRGHLDAALMYGKGVTEAVVRADGRDVGALVNIDPRSVGFKVTDDPLKLITCQWQQRSFGWQELPADLCFVSLNGAQIERPHGVSIYRSCPFVSKALRIVENATAQQWLRMGCPPFHINWDESGEQGFDDPDGSVADAVLEGLRTEWEKIMGVGRDADSGQVGDYFTAGHVSVTMLGETPGSHNAMGIEEPFRTFAEQIIGATGLPAWMLGMHWSRTERLAGVQAEMVIAHIEAIRREVFPVIEALVDLRQRLSGRSGRVKLCWTPVNLHDRSEKSRARSWEAQAVEREIANARYLWELGLLDQQRAGERIDPDLGPIALPFLMPPAPMAHGAGNVQPLTSYDETS